MSYPCRCLCLGFSQITRTTPRRLTILHFSQRRFTDGLTFTLTSLALRSLTAAPYPAKGHRHSLRPGQNLRAILGDGYRVFKMGRAFAVSCHDRPFVIQYLRPPVTDVDHRFQGEGHAWP